MAEDLWRFFRNSFFHLSSLRLSSFLDLYHPFLLTLLLVFFFSMNLTVFGIFCSSFRWEFIQSSFFLPVSLHVIILLLFSFFVAIYGNTNLKMNFLIVFFASYREFLLFFSPPPPHSHFLYFFFFFSFLFLTHWILKNTMNSLICRFLYRWEFAYFYQPPFPLLYLHPISALPHFWSTPWYIFINNRVENSRHPICQQAERVEFIPVRFQKAEILSLAGSGSKNAFPRGISMKSSIGSCWLEPPSIKRRGKHVCGRRHSRWRSGERKRVAAGERIARIFRGGKSSLPRLGKRKLGGWWFLLSSAFEWNVTSAYLGFHWWEGLHRVLIIRCAEEKRDIYTHRRDVDPIRSTST